MTLKEMLQSPEAKKMYRELAMKHHPDKGGSTSTMRIINAAKTDGDASMKRLYIDLQKENKNKPRKEKKTKKRKEKKKDYDDIKKKNDKNFDLYDTIIEIQNEINENARKFKVKDRVFLSIRKEINNNILNLVIAYTDSLGKTGTSYILDIERYRTKKELKKDIIDLIIKVM